MFLGKLLHYTILHKVRGNDKHALYITVTFKKKKKRNPKSCIKIHFIVINYCAIHKIGLGKKF